MCACGANKRRECVVVNVVLANAMLPKKNNVVEEDVLENSV